MDFVSRLIQEGYSEEDIGEILESLYILDKSGYGNVLMEEQEYIVEIKKWLSKQIARLRRAGKKVQADKLDDVAQRGGNVADDVADATKPPTKPQTNRPTNQPGSNTETARRRQIAKDKLTKNKVKPKPTKPQPTSGLANKVKTGALVAGGALAYNALTGGDPNADSNNTNTDNKTNTNNDNKPPAPEAPKSTGKFWWSKRMPTTLGYQRDPSVSSYRNIRSHNELEGNFINEAHETVVNYLISNGHADTIEEANYVMNQMDFDYIEEIVNENV